MNSCPICNDKLYTSKKKNIFLPEIGEWGNFIIKICPGTNHLIKMIFNRHKMLWLLCSLNNQYTRFIIIDYQRQQCQIICSKNNVKQQIVVNKILSLDFPNLHKIKEKVEMYITIS